MMAWLVMTYICSITKMGSTCANQFALPSLIATRLRILASRSQLLTAFAFCGSVALPRTHLTYQ